MMQLYFLSVLCLVASGLGLIFCESEDPKYKFFDFTKLQLYKLICGGVTTLISLITLFVNPEGGIIILNDLLPSLAGLLGGFTLLFIFYLEKRTTEPNEKFQKFEAFFTENKRYFGITCLAIALIHFIFPNVVVL